MSLRSFGASALLTLSIAQGSAQTTALANVKHPRVAVVLSGGTAKALTQIGVLQVLEELGVPIDAVTGTSMGAIIGGLYAAGYSPNALERLVTAENWGTFFKNTPDRRLQRTHEQLEDERFTITFPLQRARPNLPAGALSRQSIAVHMDRYLWPIHDITDFNRLPTPFGALVTDLATGDAILLQSGSLAQAIEGSAAIPGAFAPLRLADGRLVVDGAVNRNLPAEDARRLGADIVICVDVSERIMPIQKLRTLVDIVDQTVAFRVQMSNASQRPLCTVIIEPDITRLSSTAFAEGSLWVGRGRAAALLHRTDLEAIADSARHLRGEPSARRSLPPVDSVFVRRVTWNNVSVGADAIAEGAITLRDSTWVSQRQAEAAAARVFATGRFDQVSYRVVPHDSAHDLVFDLTEGDRDRLGVGVRYDTPHSVALLASARVADLVSPGSTASVSARLGEIRQYDIRDVLGEGLNAPFLQTYRVTSTSTSLRNVAATGDTKPVVFDVQQIAGQIERTLISGIVLGVDVSHEWSHDGIEGSDGPFALRSHSLVVAAATMSRDSRDRVDSPTRGTAFYWRSEAAAPSIRGSRSFTRHIIDAQGALPIVDGFSLLGSVHWGGATGVDLPLHDWFYLGGSIQSDVWRSQFVPFSGMDPQSAAGRSIRVLDGGAQLRGPADVMIALRGSLGNVFDTSPSPSTGRDYARGLGLSLSRELSPGPVSLFVASQALNRRPVVEVSFGATF
jgi:NTE family protein